jgi:hypothetical protein
MRKIIFIILAFALCFLWAEVKVEKVLETTSIKEYNQWVKKNKAKYPGLAPYYFKVECIKWGKEWKVYYYNEDGKLSREELLKAKPGWWLYVRDYSDWGKMMLVESDSSLGESSPIIHTIKNEKGDQIFSFEWGFDYCTYAGVYTLPNGIGLFRSNALENYAELLTWDGKKFGELKDIFSFTINHAATPDKKFMLLDCEGTAILIENGKERWRKSPSGNLNISANGEYICIGTNIDAEGVIFIYNSKGDLLYTYKLPHKGSGWPTSVFSADSRHLLIAFGGQTVLLNNITGKQIWQKKCEGSIVSFAKNDEYIITVSKEAQKIYIYDTLGNLIKTLNVPYGKDIKKKRIKEGAGVKVVECEVLYYAWICKVHNDLIITKSPREWHPIVFKIE